VREVICRGKNIPVVREIFTAPLEKKKRMIALKGLKAGDMKKKKPERKVRAG
jgi:hypothetical protein